MLIYIKNLVGSYLFHFWEHHNELGNVTGLDESDYSDCYCDSAAHYSIHTNFVFGG